MLGAPSSNAFSEAALLMSHHPGAISESEMGFYDTSSDWYREMDAFLEQELAGTEAPISYTEEEMSTWGGWYPEEYYEDAPADDSYGSDDTYPPLFNHFLVECNTPGDERCPEEYRGSGWYGSDSSEPEGDTHGIEIQEIVDEHHEIQEDIEEIDEAISLGFNEIQENSRSIISNSEAISSLRSKMTSSLIEDVDKSIVIGGSTSKSLKIGTGPNPTTIHEAGLEVGGENLIRRSANGAVHIGKNSLVTIEEGGRQKMWATNSAGESIDIDITNGSKLLINGRDVEKSIDNVGALSAALGSVPAISADSHFTCGFGAGTHSNAYAVSGGCASRVSNRVSVNAAIATVINNGTGDSDDNVSARAGFTFKLGKVDDSPKVAARKAAELRDEVAKLREENKAIRAESSMRQQINASLLARLERLERIASGQLSLLGDRASSD